MISQNSQHVGAVRALDVNPFQPNLFASGASESEIFIWDLNNSNSAMSPGNKIHPFEDITGVAWNRQVGDYIIVTCAHGFKCVMITSFNIAGVLYLHCHNTHTHVIVHVHKHTHTMYVHTHTHTHTHTLA